MKLMNLVKKWFLLLTLVLLANCGRPREQLSVFTWRNNIDSGVVAEFERQFDCQVVQDYFDSGEAAGVKLSSGGTSVYDVVLGIGNDAISSFRGLGLLAPLRHENLPNLKYLDPKYEHPESDPKNEYVVAYQVGVVGLYLRKPKSGIVDDSWSLIFDPAKQLGSFYLLDEVRTCIGAALRYKGYDLNTTNLGELAEARDLLIETKKRSLGFQVVSGCRQQVLSRKASVTMAWNGAVADDMREDPETYFFIPREGSTIGVDNACIPAKAPHQDLAEKFINFLCDPRIAARNAAGVGAASPIKEAQEFLPADIRNNPAMYPSPEIVSRLGFLKDLGAQTKLYDELWTQVKAK